jgi:hypothetical protein
MTAPNEERGYALPGEYYSTGTVTYDYAGTPEYDWINWEEELAEDMVEHDALLMASDSWPAPGRWENPTQEMLNERHFDLVLDRSPGAAERERHARAMATECPSCASKPGRRCKSATGKATNDHAARVRASELVTV